MGKVSEEQRLTRNVSFEPGRCSHPLCAIGHLFEAEDESQEWADLHAAIRAARRPYQAKGTMPDWDTLAEKARQPQ